LLALWLGLSPLAIPALGAAPPAKDTPTVGGLSLPEPGGWFASPPRRVVMRTPSGVQAVWTERLYRTPQGDPIQALWLEGPGTAGWAPPIGVSADDAPLGFGSRYSSVRVESLDAVLEEHPYLGNSLAIRLPSGVLTLESRTLPAEALVEAAPLLLPR